MLLGTIHRYLLRAVLGRLAVALPALALLALGFDLADQGRRLAAQLGWAPVLRASLLHLPLMAVQLCPVALLLSAVLALHSLRSRGELAAVALLGGDPGRLFAPLLTAGVLCTGASLAAGELLVPRCEQRADAIYENRRISSLTGLLPAAPWVRIDAWMVGFDRSSGELLALEVREGSVWARVDGALGPPFRGQLTDLSSLPWRQTRLHAPPPQVARAQALRLGGEHRAEALSALELHRRLRAQRAAGQVRTAEWLVLHTKLAYPLVNLLVALLACAFALGPDPRSGLTDAAAALLSLLLLWLLLAAGWTVARVDWLTPAAGAWSPLAAAAVLAGLVVAVRIRSAP